MGLVQQILPKDEWGRIDALFNGLSAPVLRLTKARAAQGRPAGTTAQRLEAIKRLFLDELYKLADVEEGINSFEERRKPAWSHRSRTGRVPTGVSGTVTGSGSR